jgi:pyridoxal phosphate enzyme (YggS family)
MTRQRRAELADNLARVRERIEQAARTAGRDPDEITLVVVTKTYPAADLDLLADLGVQHVGENRHPEAADKHAQVAGVHPLVWHFVGGLQTNKAAAVARYADVVESVDRLALVTALSTAALRAGRELDCLVQVDLELEQREVRSGCRPDEVHAMAEAVAEAEGLRLGGLMALAPLGAEPRPAFERLAHVAAHLRTEHPDAGVLSAGMSGDLEAGVEVGATHVRIGRAVLGERGRSR